MSLAIPRRNHGFPSVLAIGLCIAGIATAGWPNDMGRLAERFRDNAENGGLLFLFLLIMSWALHGVDKSQTGHRPIGSMVVFVSFGGLAIAACTQAIMAGYLSQGMGAANQITAGFWFAVAIWAVSYIHARYERGHGWLPKWTGKKKAVSSGPSLMDAIILDRLRGGDKH